MAWNLDRLTKLTQGPAWKDMSPEQQDYAMNMAYDGYYVPSMRDSGREPMPREMFLDGARNAWMFDPNYMFRSKWDDFAGQPVWRAANGVAAKLHIGFDFGHRQLTRMFTSANDGDYPPEDVPWQKTMDAWGRGAANYVDSKLVNSSEYFTRGVNTTGFFLNAAPSKSKAASVSGWAGQMAGELPFYVALGEGLGAVGGAAWDATRASMSLAEIAGGPVSGRIAAGTSVVMDAAANVTNLLNATKGGKVVISSLKGASEGYMNATIEGQSNRERLAQAVDWAAYNAIFGLVGVNLGDARQRYLGKMLSLGGKALGYNLFEQAIRRAFNNAWDIHMEPNLKMSPYVPGTPEQRVYPGVEAQETHAEINRPLLNLKTDEPVTPGIHTSAQGQYSSYLTQPLANPQTWNPDSLSDTRRDLMWHRSIYPIREHWSNGVRYASRFIGYNRNIQVNAYLGDGTRIARVDLIPRGDRIANAVQTFWPNVTRANQRGGIGAALYKEVPTIAKSYGFEGFHSEESRTESGNALWASLARRGFATPAGSLTYPRTVDGIPYPDFWRFDFNQTAKNIHGVTGTMPPRGLDDQFTWTPLTREQVADEHLGDPMDWEEMAGGRGVYDAPHPENQMQGHLVYASPGQEPVYYRYTNSRELGIQHDRLVTRARKDQARYDPVRASMGDAAEKMLYDLAHEKFGRRDISRFTLPMLNRLYAAYGQELAKAADAVPSSSPETVKEEVTQASDKSASEDPEYAAMRDRAKQEFGIDTVSSTTEHIVGQNTEQTRNWRERIRDIWRNATRRTGRESSPMAADADEHYTGEPTQAFTEEHEYEPPEGSRASYGLAPDVRRLMRNSREANMEKVRTARTRSRRFLTDVSEREGRLSSERLATDRTRVGRRDPRTWHQRLAAETTDDFVESLKRSLLVNPDDHPSGSGISFENPLSRFLFHWGDRKSLPPVLVDKLAREIRKVPGIGNVSYAQMDRASEMVARDLIQLAKIGHVKDDGRIHVYNSSEFFGTPSIWQTKLTGEVEEHEMDLLKAILANHPQELQQMNVLVKAMLQPKRRASYGIEDWIKWNRAIDDAMRGVVTPEVLEELRSERAAARQRAARVQAPATTTAPPTRRRRRPRPAPEEPTVPS